MDHQAGEPTRTEALTDRDLITAANQRNSPLLRLPAELRNRVYELAFDDAIVYVQDPRDKSNSSFTGTKTGAIALHSICRQIRHEAALSLFYTRSMFNLEGYSSPRGINSSEMIIGPNKCKLITSLQISWATAYQVIETARYFGWYALHFRLCMGGVYCTAFPTLKRVHVSGKDWTGEGRDSMGDFMDKLREFFEKKELEVTFENEWTKSI